MTTTAMTDSKTLSLIADLLARAEGGTTQAERDLSLKRAQREATRHGIDLAVAAHLKAQRGVPMQPEERKVTIGRKEWKGNSYRLPAGIKIFTDLFLRIAEANDIECLIALDGSAVFAHGMPDDIDMAETLYASLVVQMNVAAEEWLATEAYKDGYTEEYWDDRLLLWKMRRPNKGVARREFQRSFTQRIGMLLLDARCDAHDEAEEAAEARIEDTAGTENHRAVTTTAIALREKSEAVQAFHQKKIKDQNIRSSYRGERGGRAGNLEARTAGRRAAERADTTGRGSREIGN